MVSERIRIDFALDEGAMLRILGLVERRGFRIVRMTMHETGANDPGTPKPGGGETAAMTLDVVPRDAGRRLAVLVPQLHRLYEVRSVGLFSTPMASAA